MKFPALFKNQKIYWPTPFGWTAVLATAFILIFIFLHNVYYFLAVTKPVDSNIFIVEGWVPDYCLENVYEKYLNHSIAKIFVTGGPVEQGSYLINFKNFASLGAASLEKLGIPDSLMIKIPAPYVQKDRTYTSAVALKKWFLIHKNINYKVNIVTLGVHARRSKVLFQKALSKSVTVGVIAIPDKDYDPTIWYLSSNGLKTVLVEIISYVYTVIFLFHHDLK